MDLLATVVQRFESNPTCVVDMTHVGLRNNADDSRMADNLDGREIVLGLPTQRVPFCP